MARQTFNFLSHFDCWTTVLSSFSGLPRTGQSRDIFCSVYYGSCNRWRLVVSSSTPRKLPHAWCCTQRRRVPRSRSSWLCRLEFTPVANYDFLCAPSVVTGAGVEYIVSMVCGSVDFVYVVGVLFVRLLTNSPVISLLHGKQLLSYCTVGHTTRLTPPPRHSVTGLLRSLSTLTFAPFSRAAKTSVRFVSPSCDLSRSFRASASSCISFFLFSFCLSLPYHRPCKWVF